MERWQDEAIVLAARPHGEGHAIVSVLARARGHWRGHVRGGASSRQRGLWQPGNVLAVAWSARLADQLGHLTGEPVAAIAAAAMDQPWSLAILASACAVAEAALPEHEPHPLAYAGLAGLLARIGEGASLAADYVRWEVALLAELGYGLDLSACAVTGRREGLAYVSPRTGRAVTAEGAGAWAERLLVLPRFLRGDSAAGPGEVAAGLRLTGHFLARDVFGLAHRPVPAARLRLAERAEAEGT
ncbi:DNA repair protein RecO [Elioraea sp.]|jgi:DNA repair protein RecO (recombination protein O)|uniref:DNA repair protein RecO n=1 Tax=Elioraea sp. TaxID=2185103 RepID=UPI0021DD1B0A|nr:DNA repair protein RecO [Elioraea sp.]GIX10479.1 MAG: DNA repair protein RecO [Elioraea sp.]